MSDIDSRLLEANARLKAALIGVTIQKIGDRLYLRATLPPKPNSSKVQPHQQRISLNINASSQGIKRAEAEAIKIGGLLAWKEFKWESYLPSVPVLPLGISTAGELVNQFEQDYFNKRERTHKTESTWKSNYLQVFKRLPVDSPLTVDLIKETILRTKPDSRTRRGHCLALGALARFCGIEFDTKPFIGKYSIRTVTPRDLPTDAEIAEWYYKIKSPEWRWYYGMVATFGLRNHEVFHLDIETFSQHAFIANILDGKTGERQVWAYYPEWVEQFNLAEVKMPSINLNRPNKSLGKTASQHFRKQECCPFTLLSLRHCWAVRTLEFGLNVSFAAQQMGHSVVVHSSVYHHWISSRHHQNAFQSLTSSPNRPLPPPVNPLA